MVYGRSINDQILNFEASGALMSASLVMRDRETDSWWSIMTSDAIGGQLEGTDLEEWPVSKKSQWRDWVRDHPDTLVLSVAGVEHVENNPYDNYFSSDGTFRGLEIDDHRLAPKAPIYSFWFDGKPYAIAHERFAGGALLDLGNGKRVFLHRDPDASFFASSSAFFVGDDADLDQLKEWLAQGETESLTAVGGFDTYWYSWVAINKDSVLVD